MIISVVVPVYNMEKYLNKCLDCLLKQTYDNLEIIFVDDGSMDNSLKILEKQTKGETRAKVIHKENGGLSSARNAGMDVATGDYIFFLDADDWIDYDYMENCVAVLKKYPVSVLFTPYIREYRSGSVKNKLFEEDSIYFRDEEVKNILLLRLFGPCGQNEKNPIKIDNMNTAWGKFYKREVVKKIRFAKWQDVGTAEDMWFNIHIFYNADSAYYLGNQFLHYNKTNSNSLASTYHPEVNYIKRNLLKMMKDFALKNQLGDVFFEAIKNRFVLSIFSDILSVCYSNMKKREKRKICKKLLSEEKYCEAIKKFDYSHMQTKWKVFYKLVEIRQVELVLDMVLVAIQLREKLNK